MFSKSYSELNPTPHSDKPGPLRGLLAFVIVAVLGVCCAYIEQIVSWFIVACGG